MTTQPMARKSNPFMTLALANTRCVLMREAQHVPLVDPTAECRSSRRRVTGRVQAAAKNWVVESFSNESEEPQVLRLRVFGRYEDDEELGHRLAVRRCERDRPLQAQIERYRLDDAGNACVGNCEAISDAGRCSLLAAP